MYLHKQLDIIAVMDVLAVIEPPCLSISARKEYRVNDWF